MINEKTFLQAIEIVHGALYGLGPLNTKEDYIILRTLIAAYIALLTDFHPDSYDAVRDFLIQHPTYEEDEALLLYSFLTDNEDLKD